MCFKETSYLRDTASAAFTWTTRRSDTLLLATIRPLVLKVIFKARRSVAARQPLSPSSGSTHQRLGYCLVAGCWINSERKSCGSAQNKYSQCVWCGKIPRRDPGLACDVRAAGVLPSRFPLRTWDASGSSTQWPVEENRWVTDEFIVLHLLCLNVTRGPLPYENEIYWRGLKSECWVEYWDLREWKLQKATSRIRRGVYEILALVGCYAA
jgi:hypothetical protein